MIKMYFVSESRTSERKRPDQNTRGRECSNRLQLRSVDIIIIIFSTILCNSNFPSWSRDDGSVENVDAITAITELNNIRVGILIICYIFIIHKSYYAVYWVSSVSILVFIIIFVTVFCKYKLSGHLGKMEHLVLIQFTRANVLIYWKK